MEYIVALDLSLSNTGIAIFNDNGQCVKLISIDTHKDKSYPLKLKHIEKVMLEIKRTYKPKIVLIEESFTRFNKSTQAIYRVHGVAELIFYKSEQIRYPTTLVRKEILGHGNAKKEELRDFIIEHYCDVKFDDLDQSDAFGLGLCYFKKEGIFNG